MGPARPADVDEAATLLRELTEKMENMLRELQSREVLSEMQSREISSSAKPGGWLVFLNFEDAIHSLEALDLDEHAFGTRLAWATNWWGLSQAALALQCVLLEIKQEVIHELSEAEAIAEAIEEVMP